MVLKIQEIKLLGIVTRYLQTAVLLPHLDSVSGEAGLFGKCNAGDIFSPNLILPLFYQSFTLFILCFVYNT